MTWRWLICFSGLAAFWLPARTAVAGSSVTGRVELANSRDPAVRKSRNYSGVVIWLEPAGRAAPSATDLPRVKMQQRDKRFVPHVLAIPVGATVDFPNLDPIFHNAFSNFSGQPFDVGLYAPGTSRSVTFRHAGIVRVFCNIHSTMSAIIAVVPSPWFAVTPASGAFRIGGVPPGEYRIRLFHERALPETLDALERRIAVPEEGLELPPISVSETGFIPGPHLNKYGREYPPLTDETLYPGANK
jgi:plastocyanin